MSHCCQLSKKERRRLKKEQKRLRGRQEARRSQIAKSLTILGGAILLVGLAWGWNLISAKRYENAPRIQVTPKVYNFGKVIASQGTVETTFEVKNVGVSKLVLSGMETSCGCTTAILEKDGQRGPTFGMHNNPTDWRQELAPQETASLKVIFDPNFHETFGPVTRVISIFSSDPGRGEEKITIYADVQR